MSLTKSGILCIKEKKVEQSCVIQEGNPLHVQVKHIVLLRLPLVYYVPVYFPF